MPVVSNTSPLFNLAAIHQIHLLRQQFGEILIPEAVHGELLAIRELPEWGPIQQGLEQGWISTRSVRDRKTAQALAADLDPGEAEAIALALELELSRILIDESAGRTAASRLGLDPTGVLGVLLKAKGQGQLESVTDSMRDLKNRAGFYIHAELFQKIARLAEE